MHLRGRQACAGSAHSLHSHPVCRSCGAQEKQKYHLEHHNPGPEHAHVTTQSELNLLPVKAVGMFLSETFFVWSVVFLPSVLSML